MAASSVPHRVETTFRVKGLKLTDHFFTVPLDHGFNGGGGSADDSTIEVFAREVVAADKKLDDASLAAMPWLVYLQGGPGFECARVQESGGWISHASQTHRILLLDQRGTGRSTPVSSSGLARIAPDDPETQAAYLANFRADSIVADAELVRKTLAGEDTAWSLLGQSFGGFCITRYLGHAPEGVAAAYLTGGLPPLVHEADAAAPTYRALIERVRTQNAKFYRRFPADVEVVRGVAKFIADQPDGRVATPAGGQLSVRGLQALGFSSLGTSMESLHYHFEKAWEVPGEELSYAFLKGCDDAHAFDTNPIYACLHESIYCNGGGPSAWAAERVFVEAADSGFDAAAAIADESPAPPSGGGGSGGGGGCGGGGAKPTPVLFTGEMVFPFMFDEITALRPLKAVASVLAAKSDWPPLYDLDALRKCEVPVACASYVEDMFVDFALATETASRIGRHGARVWSTSEYMHSGVREDGARILKKLMQMASDEEPLR